MGFGMVVAAAAVVAGGLTAAARGEELVEVSVVADVSAVKPGQPFSVGMLMQIQPGWHIYWSNPGDGGVPTEVRFVVPEGFTVSDVRFPLPLRFIQPGEITGYGYKDQVMLLAEITPPAELPPGPVTIRAEATWLACDPRVCILGDAELELELPVAEQSQAVHAELFDQWRQQLPVTAEEDPFLAEVEIRHAPAPGGAETAGSITLNWERPVRDVILFFNTPDELGVRSSLTQGDQPSRIEFTARLLGTAPFDGNLALVVGYTDEKDRRRAVQLAIPLRLERGR